jgi:hypothetical protein
MSSADGAVPDIILGHMQQVIQGPVMAPLRDLQKGGKGGEGRW